LIRLVLPIAGVVALYLFTRGHNESGGGFVAGLVASVALILQYIAGRHAMGRVTPEPAPLALARRRPAAGLQSPAWGALAFGYPFLTTHTAQLHLPLVGEMHVPSALFFDMGVFASSSPPPC
jgi:multicomponent K+:H+ antiporter subunit A